MPNRRARRLRHRDDGGFAMVLVLGSMLVLTILVTGALFYATSNIAGSRRAQDYGAAMAAAQAGVEDYLQKLYDDNTYWQNNNVDPANQALVDPANPATANNWKLVPGVNAASYAVNSAPEYQYSVLQDYQSIITSGLITLKVTGRVRGVQRTIYADLRKPSLLKYAYFTDLETLDPAMYPSEFGVSAAAAAAACDHYYYADPSSSDPKSKVARSLIALPGGGTMACADPVFSSADKIDGDMHTNDAIAVSGNPQFKGAAESSWGYAAGETPVAGAPASPAHPWYAWSGAPGGSHPTPTTAPVVAAPLVLPPNNTQLEQAADKTYGGKGCLYTGQTKITFLSDGSWTVDSPYTTGADPGLNAWCLPAGGSGTVTPPASFNGVIYVKGVPAAVSTDCATTNAGYPEPGDQTDTAALNPGFDCRAGSAFVSGVVKGQVTVGTDADIVVTNNLTYAGGQTGTDVLGLVANGFVQIYHPLRSIGGGNYQVLNSAPHNLTIDAAIMSVQHSFTLWNYDKGPALGTLTVFGTIAQEFRGPVGVLNASGYNKNYIYDSRLLRLQPPAYLDPTSSLWQLQDYSEQQPG